MEGLDHQRAVNLLKSVSGESLIIKHHLGPWKHHWLTIVRLKNSQYSFGHFEHVPTVGLSSRSPLEDRFHWFAKYNIFRMICDWLHVHVHQRTKHTFLYP